MSMVFYRGIFVQLAIHSAGINHQQMDWYNVHLVMVNDKGAFVASSF